MGESLIHVHEAEQLTARVIDRVLAQSEARSPRSIPLSEAVGEVLAESIRADRADPPFHRVTMDGVALNLAQWIKGQRRFFVEAMHKAGNDPPFAKRARAPNSSR